MIPLPELQTLLRRPYDRGEWIAVLRRLFPGLEAFEKPQARQIDDFRADSILQIGSIRLADDRRLAVLEVSVGKQVKLLRNRVGLRNLVASYIDQQAAHGVLAVFRSSQPAFRLTFAARTSELDGGGQLVRRETAARRYTFVLGPDESCRTAAERFERLSSRGDAVALADVTDAFSVEKLNREFFDQYRAHYEKFVAHVLGSEPTAEVFALPRRFKSPEEKDKALKPVRDFVKKLLGRLVFLHFIQKKGWLGCPKDHRDWRAGDPDFLQTWFGRQGGTGRFYRSFLVPLFYDALNRADRPDDLFEPAAARVPYLNGGLFEREKLPIEKLDLPDALFGELLGFLGQYNFTVDENDPEDHEVGIDPEMLGHIFENLLEDNKDKGAFYTPKSIVQYMCQQSLLHYLSTHLLPDTRSPKPETHYDALERLVCFKDAGDPKDKQNWVRAQAREIERRLDDVRICDPAIGSGAFPIGLLQEIFWIKLTLDWTLDGAETKRKIIQNSIYGVDLDAGAVEIARLRCWLALVVEEEQPRPLPNLDYKIMQGDSLLESFEGIPLDRLHGEAAAENEQMDLMGFAAPGQQAFALTTERAADLRRMTASYFESYDPAEKARLHAAIDRLVLDHLDYNIRRRLDELTDQIAKAKSAFAQKLAKLKKDQRAAYSREAKEKVRIAKLEQEYDDTRQKKDKLKALEATHERPYFLWHLFFQDVFARGGFDIAIANPPYVRHEVISDYRERIAPYYTTAASRADLFVFFYERAAQLLRAGGVLTFISSNKYYRSAYGEPLRKFLGETFTIHEMIDFGDSPVFEAIAYASIFVGSKAPQPEGHCLRGYTWRGGQDLECIHDIVADCSSVLHQSQLQPQWWLLESSRVLSLLAKLRSSGTQLAQIPGAHLHWGIRTGLNEAFIIDESTRTRLLSEDPNSAQLIFPYLRGRDVKRWIVTWADLYVIAFPHGFHEQLCEYPAVLRHLSRFENDLKNRGQCKTSRGGSSIGQHHWLELDNNPKSSYLEEFRKTKIVIPAISGRNNIAVDTAGYISNNKTSFLASPDAEYLAAVLNSRVALWFARQVFATKQNSFLDFEPRYSGQWPIPPASPSDKEKLSGLARRAVKAAGAELLEIEEEINRIVYRLFALTPEEIAVIEQATGAAKPALDNKTALFTHVLPALKERAAYFSIEAIRRRLTELRLDISDGSLRQYLSDAMAEGLIFDAGHGWYSRIENPLLLVRKPVAALIRAVETAFPKVDFVCWSTAQVNPYAQHLLGKHTAFLYADADFLSSIAERLREAGWDVLTDPNRKTVRELHRPGEKSVILRPALAKQPAGESHQAPPEKALVDLIVEADEANLMESAEAHRLFAEAAIAGRITISAAAGYADRRRISLRRDSDSQSTQSVFLWS